MATDLNNLALCLEEQAHSLESQVKFFQSRVNSLVFFLWLGGMSAFLSDDPQVTCISDQDYVEAGRLLKRSLAIREHTLGPIHPDVAVSLNNQAGLLVRQVRCCPNFKADSSSLLSLALLFFVCLDCIT